MLKVLGALAVLGVAALPVFAQKTPLPNAPSAPDEPMICDAIAGNLVSNCGFETGDFSDWTLSGNTSFTVVASNIDGFLPNSGDFFAALGPFGSDGFLSQILTTVPGQEYTLSWYLGSDGQTPNDFDAEIDGVTLFSQVDLPSTGGSYVPYSETFTAAGSSTLLTFSFRNDFGFLALDDVSAVVVAVPEPASIGLLMAALGAVGWRLRKRLCRSRQGLVVRRY